MGMETSSTASCVPDVVSFKPSSLTPSQMVSGSKKLAGSEKMVEAPSLISLCLDTITEQLERASLSNVTRVDDGDDDFIANIYELPSELFDSLLPRLSALALENLQQHVSCHTSDAYGPGNGNSGVQGKRKRLSNFEMAWKKLYQARWPSLDTQCRSVIWSAKQHEAKDERTDDWQQIYWERHLQNCLDAAAEVALLPRYAGTIGIIEIPAVILTLMGGGRDMTESMYGQFSDHCKQFGLHARCLRLPSALCIPEICHLLRNSRLESLEIQWIKSEKHVDGLCRLLKQNVETLKSIEFIYCKLSTSFVNAICDSLCVKGLNTQRIQHFSIKASSFLENDSGSLPAGLASFLSSGRYLSSLRLCDDHLHQNFMKMVLDTLLDASSSLTVLDLSENNITGWLWHFKWSSTNKQQLSFGIDKSLESLRVLNLRNCNLQKEDADCLKYMLVHLPKLDTLDLSDNPIEDDGIRSMLPYFAEIMAERDFPLVDLKLGNCELTCDGVSQLLGTLLTWKKPLSSFSIRENELGSKFGRSFGKFLCKGIQDLDIENIGLGSIGFRDALEEINGELMLIHINISENRGGIEIAKFLSKLMLFAPELVAIIARYNFLPSEFLSVFSSNFEVTKGKLEHLDLTGNPTCGRSADASLLAKFQINGKCILKLDESHTLAVVQYDHDP